MTTPASGAISINDLAVELGIANTGLSLNDSRVRTLVGLASGAIDLNTAHGKSDRKIVAGSGSNPGYSNGYDGQARGSITNTVLNGATIDGIYTVLFGDATQRVYVILDGQRAQNFFSTFTINGQTFSTASPALYVQQPSYAVWNWFVSYQFAVGTTYPHIFT